MFYSVYVLMNNFLYMNNNLVTPWSGLVVWTIATITQHWFRCDRCHLTAYAIFKLEKTYKSLCSLVITRLAEKLWEGLEEIEQTMDPQLNCGSSTSRWCILSNDLYMQKDLVIGMRELTVWKRWYRSFMRIDSPPTQSSASCMCGGYEEFTINNDSRATHEYTTSSYLTLRRSDRFWSSVRSDTTIETTLIRSFKSRGDVVTGVGIYLIIRLSLSIISAGSS